jgi:hypothetical protein
MFAGNSYHDVVRVELDEDDRAGTNPQTMRLRLYGLDKMPVAYFDLYARRGHGIDFKLKPAQPNARELELAELRQLLADVSCYCPPHAQDRIRAVLAPMTAGMGVQS